MIFGLSSSYLLTILPAWVAALCEVAESEQVEPTDPEPIGATSKAPDPRWPPRGAATLAGAVSMLVEQAGLASLSAPPIEPECSEQHNDGGGLGGFFRG